MDSPTQPSFIPQDAGQPLRLRSEGGSGLSELFLLVSILLLVVSIALAGGVFLYTEYLQSAVKSKQDQLSRAEAAFDPSLVQQFTRLDNRMKAAQALLSQHRAPTLLFGILEKTTAQDISYSDFSYDASDGGDIKLKMSGVAGSVNSIALQAELFSQSGVITNPIFSDINAGENGINFNFTGDINPSSIAYQDLVNGGTPTTSQAPAQQGQQAQPASPFGGAATSTE